MRSFCRSSSVLCWIELVQLGDSVPRCLPNSCTATPSHPAVSAGASLETPTWTMTPGESRTSTVSGLYRLSSQQEHACPQSRPGPRHLLNRNYPAVELGASHLTLTVGSAGQQLVASCSPWAIQYTGLLPVPTLTVSEWEGAWHFQAAFSWSWPWLTKRDIPGAPRSRDCLVWIQAVLSQRVSRG